MSPNFSLVGVWGIADAAQNLGFAGLSFRGKFFDALEIGVLSCGKPLKISRLQSGMAHSGSAI